MSEKILTPEEVREVEQIWMGRTIYPGSEGQRTLALCASHEAMRAELTRLRGVVEEGVGSVRRFLDKDEQVTKALGPIIDYVPTNINPPKGPGQIGGKICVTYCMNGG